MTATVAVAGLGAIGLPLARALDAGDHGFDQGHEFLIGHTDPELAADGRDFDRAANRIERWEISHVTPSGTVACRNISSSPMIELMPGAWLRVKRESWRGGLVWGKGGVGAIGGYRWYVATKKACVCVSGCLPARHVRSGYGIGRSVGGFSPPPSQTGRLSWLWRLSRETSRIRTWNGWSGNMQCFRST